MKEVGEFLIALERRWPGTRVTYCNACARAKMMAWQAGLGIGKEKIDKSIGG